MCVCVCICTHGRPVCANNGCGVDLRDTGGSGGAWSQPDTLRGYCNRKLEIIEHRKREREGERAGKEKNKERDMPYSTSLHTYFLTRARKQEVDCITNKHREQEGGRWESFATLTEDVVCATHLRAEREPQTSLTHTHTHTRRLFPPRLYRSMVRTGGRSQPSSDHPPPRPHPSLPLVSAAVASTLLFSQQLSPQGPTPATHKHTRFVTRLTLWKMLTVCDLYFSQKRRRAALAHIRMRIHADCILWSPVSFIF